MKAMLLALPLAALAPAGAGAQAPETVQLEYEWETLPNGLRVVYHVDRSTPVAVVNVGYNVGSRHEPPGRTGFAHLFEHMMFKGSRNVADGQHFALLEDAGARAISDINGRTTWDYTNYWEQVPSNQLELALWLEADRMGTLLERLTPEKLENQREVVKNERRQSVDNQPYGSWQEKTFSLLFPAGHPYHTPVYGSMEDLSAATVDDVAAFFRTWYAPDNAVLAIAGDIDVEQAKAMVRRHFGDIPRGPERPPVTPVAVPERIGRPVREVVQDPNASAPAVYVAYRVPPSRDPQSEAASLVAWVLNARSSGLHDVLVRRRQLATRVDAFLFGLMEGADALFVVVRGSPGSSADSLEAALMAELDDIDRYLTQEALERARAELRFAILDRLQSTMYRANLLAGGALFYDDPGWANRQLEESARVTVDDMRRVAAERMGADNRVVVVYVPARPSTPGDR